MSFTGKPKTARGKRVLEDREPKAFENEKTAMFIKGNKSSQTIQDVLKDLVRQRLRAILIFRLFCVPPEAIRPSLIFITVVNDPRQLHCKSAFIFGVN
jgi:ribosome production factor 2